MTTQNEKPESYCVFNPDSSLSMGLSAKVTKNPIRQNKNNIAGVLKLCSLIIKCGLVNNEINTPKKHMNIDNPKIELIALSMFIFCFLFKLLNRLLFSCFHN